MKCFPMKTKFISLKRFKNQWITSDIKRLINEKSKSFKRRIYMTEENDINVKGACDGVKN